VIIGLGLSLDQSRQINHLAAGRGFGEGQGLMIDDARSEAILREYVNLPLEKWRTHEHWPLTLTAEESVQFGLAHAIADWVPPAGASISTI
jgi:hypothetical protein